MPINQKIHTITHALGPVEKKGKGPDSMGGFPFIRVEDILSAVRPLMEQHGVIMKTELVNVDHSVQLAVGKAAMDGTPILDGKVPNMRAFTYVQICYTFIDIDDDSEFSVTIPAESIDIQDKASRKAMTSALKTALMQVFLITDQADDGDEVDVAALEGGAPAVPQNRGRQKLSDAANGGKGTPKAQGEKAPPSRKPAVDPRSNVIDNAIKAGADPVTYDTPELTDPEVPPTPTTTEKEWAPDPADVAAALEITAPSTEEKILAIAESLPDTPVVETESAGPVEDTPDALKTAKLEFREAVSERGGMTNAEVDALALEYLGKPREVWIKTATGVRAVTKLVRQGLAPQEQG